MYDADDNLVIPSENILRRMNYKEKHKYNLSKGWRDNLMAFSISSQNLINVKNLNGFFRRIVIEQDFAMILHTQKQVDVLKYLQPKHRILRLDATGNLVKIPKKDREYPKILSYFLQVKDLRDLGIVVI